MDVNSEKYVLFLAVGGFTAVCNTKLRGRWKRESQEKYIKQSNRSAFALVSICLSKCISSALCETKPKTFVNDRFSVLVLTELRSAAFSEYISWPNKSK